ncbi:MAG TPA: hypothetical protein DCL53_10475, partial [Thauera sp.]|nr:hypothetical protein [Thauera sp.]
MKTQRTTLALVIALALTGIAPAHAFVLGEPQALSAIGEPFRVEIPLSGQGRDAAGCFQVAAATGASSELPQLTGARTAVAGTGASARLVVTRNRPVNDPIVTLVIENVCESRLRREYTLLLPYPSSAISPAQITPAAPPPSVQTARPARPAAVAPANVRTWNTAPGESLESLAHALYPDDTGARSRFIRATAGANPDLFPDDASRRRPLPTGTAVLVPDLRRLSGSAPSTPPKAAAARAPRPAAASSAARVAQDRVEVDKAVSPGAQRATAPGGTAVPLDVQARERELAAAIDRSIIVEMELLARIKELEELQARLEARIRALDTAPVAAPQPPAPLVAAPAV